MQRKLFIILYFILITGFRSFAQGNLLITPKRIVFDGIKQKEELNLMNTGTDTATYSISFRHYNMTEQGNLDLIRLPDTSQMFADPYLRIFPRQVTLAPGEAQVIIIQCRRKTDMSDGEYRTHLWFRSEKNYEVLRKVEPLLDSNQMSVNVIPVFGITIPVIIRSGNVNVSAALNDLHLGIKQDTIPYMKFAIIRTGNISIYGNFKVEYISAQGKPYNIGTLKSVGVYTNINKRFISIKLNKPPGMTFENGRMKVLYTSPDEAKYVVYAEGELSLK